MASKLMLVCFLVAVSCYFSTAKHEEDITRCYFNGNFYTNGRIIYNGCNICKCHAGIGWACTRKACPGHCQMDLKYYPSGTTGLFDGCNNCHCYKGNLACTLKYCFGLCHYRPYNKWYEPGDTIYIQKDKIGSWCICQEGGKFACTR